MPDELNRRDFLSVCSILAASLACAGTTQRTRIASSFITDPALDDYRETLRAVIRTVLPADSADFPLDVPFVERRLLRMFPLEDERQFLPLQRALTVFDQLDLAPHIAPPLLAAERIALDVPARTAESDFRQVCASSLHAESRSCDAFFARFGPVTRFSSLEPEARIAWLQLWNASEFSVKREFAGRLRVIVMLSAYSADRIWPAIGYDGPLVGGPERRT